MLQAVIILALALLLDFVVGEPPAIIHPVIWVGKFIDLLKLKFKNKNPKIEKIGGIVLAVITIAFFAGLFWAILFLVKKFLGDIAFILASAIILKSTFSIRYLRTAVNKVVYAVKTNNIELARRNLSYIVSRDTSNLNSNQIISGTIECTSESTVDGIIAPIFYFALFGVVGAVVYRVINTLDSMVGYKDGKYCNIGQFSAWIDEIVNFIPARITGALMIVASALCKMDWKNAWRVMIRDKSKTESINSGWPMAATAGALMVQLEKPNYYQLGEPMREISIAHVDQSYRITLVTTLLFITLVVLPTIFILGLIR